MPDTTELLLSGMGVPPYSARGIEQTLVPIAQVQNARRTVDGDLVDISAVQFRKYASTVTCRDWQAPALDGIWPGMILEVDCVAELAYDHTGEPEREAVEGSEREEDGFFFYRPHLTMMVMNFEISRNEYGAETGWTLTLEEV